MRVFESIADDAVGSENVFPLAAIDGGPAAGGWAAASRPASLHLRQRFNWTIVHA